MEALIKLLQAMSYPTIVFVGLAIKALCRYATIQPRLKVDYGIFNNYLIKV